VGVDRGAEAARDTDARRNVVSDDDRREDFGSGRPEGFPHGEGCRYDMNGHVAGGQEWFARWRQVA
jgi:hypothetical protein